MGRKVLQLVHDHQSISRNLAQVQMDRMSKEEIRDVIVTRIKRLRMKISDDALWRITYLSAGLPFYAHSLGKYSTLQAISDNRTEIKEDDVTKALEDCLNTHQLR